MLALVPCFIYLRDDSDPVHCNEAPDVVFDRVTAAPPDDFVHVTITAYAHDDEPRTGFVRASEVAAILPMHPRQLEAELDDPPDWYADK